MDCGRQLGKTSKRTRELEKSANEHADGRQFKSQAAVGTTWTWPGSRVKPAVRTKSNFK